MKTKRTFLDNFDNQVFAKCNKLMLFTAIFLLGIGIIAVLSADNSQLSLASKGIKQMFWVCVGVFATAFFAFFDYKKLAAEKPLKIILLILIAMLVTLAICSIINKVGNFGLDGNGKRLNYVLNTGLFEIRRINSAYRWFDFKFFNIQPSIVIKIVLIIFTAFKLSQPSTKEKKTIKIPKKNKNNSDNSFDNFKSFCREYKDEIIFGAIITITLVSIAFQPSNTVVFSIFTILLAMFMLKNAKFVGFAVILVLFAVIAWNTSSYFSKRLGGDNFQSEQAVLAISTGGLKGYGLGQGEHKYGRLPEPENDFVFAIIAQETGFIGSILFLIAYAIFITTGFLTAIKTQDDFGKYLAFGITANYAFFFLMHFAVNLGFLNTGASLPFVSYGGTAIVVDMAMLGILLNISASSSSKKYERIRQ